MIEQQYQWVKNYLTKYFLNIKNGTDYDVGQPILSKETSFSPIAFIFPHADSTEPSYVLTVPKGSAAEFVTNLVVLSPMLAGHHLILGLDIYAALDPENLSEEYEGLSLEQRYTLQDEGEDEVILCLQMMGLAPSRDLYHISSLGYKELEDGKVVFIDKGIEYTEVTNDEVGSTLGDIFTYLAGNLKENPLETTHKTWAKFLADDASGGFFDEGEDKQPAIDAWNNAFEIEGAVEAGRQVIVSNMMAAAKWRVLSMSEAEGKAVLDTAALIQQEPDESEIVQCLTNAKLIT